MSSIGTDHDGEWVALHSYMPMSRQTGFLRDVVRPAVRDAGLWDRFFFLRYWQGGPHVRLRLHRPSGPAVEAVRAALAAGIPALTDEQAAEYEQQASLQRGLADLEGAEPVDSRPAGTVEPTPYLPEYAKYGGTTGIRIAEQLFRSTSAAVLDLVAGRSDVELAAPAGLAIRIMSMSLKGSGLDMGRSQTFLRAYEDDWLRWVPPGYDEKWAGMYATTRAKVMSLCRAVWIDGTTDVFHDTYATASSATRAVQDRPPGGAVSELVLGGTPYTHCLANYVHVTNNRLGIVPAAEAFLAYVIRRSLADLQATSDSTDESGAAVRAPASGSR